MRVSPPESKLGDDWECRPVGPNGLLLPSSHVMAPASSPSDALASGGRPSGPWLASVVLALPALGVFAYIIGALTLAAQYQQSGLPWKSAMALTDARALLTVGVRATATAIFVGLISAAAAFGLAIVAGWFERRVENRPDLGAVKAWLLARRSAFALMYAAFGVFFWALFLTVVTALGPVEEWLRWTTTAVAAIRFVTWGWTLYPASQHRTIRKALMAALLAAFLVTQALYGPAYLSAFLVLGAVGTYVVPRQLLGVRATADRVRHPAVQLVTIGLFVLYGLIILSGADLRLDTVKYPAAHNGVAGLLAVSGDYDVLVTCDSSNVERTAPMLVRTGKSRTRDAQISRRQYKLPQRGSASVVSLLFDTKLSAVRVSTHGTCGE